MRRRIWMGVGVLLIVAILAVVEFWIISHPSPMVKPNFTQVSPVHAMRVDFVDVSKSRNDVAALETRMKQVGINLVALGAGRVDWTYFPWKGHSDRWADEVKGTGIDFLAADSARFGQWAHIAAVVDVLAPRYIQEHPEAAAITWIGKPSPNLVGTMELVDGEFGRELLDMITVISANYPVNSIMLTELVYYVDGYGDKDKTAYLAFTGRTDWPRGPSGEINIDDPSISNWRSYELALFLEKAAAVVHQHQKQLFVEVHAAVDSTGQVTIHNGLDIPMVLKYADRVVAWGSDAQGGWTPGILAALARYAAPFGENRTILMIGLWDRHDAPDLPKQQLVAIPAGDLMAELSDAQQGGAADLMVTPSFLAGEAHWQVLEQFWRSN